MKSLISVFLIALIGTGCGPTEIESDTPDAQEEETNWGEGIVSENPPQYGDDDSGSVDSSEPEEELVFGFLETDCGHDIGDNACDFRLRDQNDDPWRLSDYAGDVVLLDLSAAWCAPCQAAAMTAQHTQDEYADRGFHYVTLLIVDSQNDTVELPEVQSWAATFGIHSAPVLQASRDLLTSGGAPGHGYPLSSWPTFIVLDRSQNVASGLYGFNEAYIRQMIENEL